jgi:hypothetical protein
MALDPETKLIIDTFVAQIEKKWRTVLEGTTQTSDVTVVNTPSVDATGQGDVPITLDGEVPEVQGDAAEDAPVSGNPVLTGGRYDATGRSLDDGDVGAIAVYPDGSVFTKEFLIEVQKGNVPGHSLVHKLGRNDAVPNGSWAHISLTPFAIANFRQTPVAMRIKAGGNSSDTAAGAGAREVTVQGIGSALSEVSMILATNGTAVSSNTTGAFWRVHRSWVSAVGTYTGANLGDIVIEDSGGGADFITIATDEGQTQYAGWTIETGKTGYLLRVWGTADGLKPADVRLYTRNDIDTVAAPMQSKRLKLWWDGVTGRYEANAKGPEIILNAKSDIWMEARGSGALTEVTANLEILLVDN